MYGPAIGCSNGEWLPAKGKSGGNEREGQSNAMEIALTCTNTYTDTNTSRQTGQSDLWTKPTDG